MKRNIAVFVSLLVLLLNFSSLNVVAQTADEVRGGWIADVDGVRHVYLLVIRDKTVTGIYCTDCSNPSNLAFIEEGVLDDTGLRFNVYHDNSFTGTGAEGVTRASVHAELIEGELHVQRRILNGNNKTTTMVMHRSPPEELRAAPPGGFAPAPHYEPPAAFQKISESNVLGLWLYGEGPGKQYFMFKRHRGEVLGMVCGQCDDTSDMAVLDGITMKGEVFHFDIVHEDSGPGIIEYGPHKNITDAKVSRNEMHLSVVPSFEGPGFTPIEMTLLGPVIYQP